MFSIFRDLKEPMDNMGNLWSSVGQDPSLLGDRTWKMSVSAELDKLLRVADRISAVTDIPPGYEETHSYMLEAAEELRFAVSYEKKFLDTGLGSHHKKSVEHINMWTEKVNQAIEVFPTP